MADIRVEYVALGDLTGWPENPKAHDEVGIRASIERFGFKDPVAVDEASGRMVEGHGRAVVLGKMRAEGADPPEGVRLADDGGWLVPVLRGINFADEAEARAAELAGRRAVLLGLGVARAFGLDPRRLGLLTWSEPESLGFAVAVVPHPSGVNRWWNDGGNREAVRRFLFELVDDEIGC